MRATPGRGRALHLALRKSAVNWEPVIGGGYTRARFADGSTAFVKAADEEPYSSALRREVAVYESVEGPFLPRLVGAPDAHWTGRPTRSVCLDPAASQSQTFLSPDAASRASATASPAACAA